MYISTSSTLLINGSRNNIFIHYIVAFKFIQFLISQEPKLALSWILSYLYIYCFDKYN